MLGLQAPNASGSVLRLSACLVPGGVGLPRQTGYSVTRPFRGLKMFIRTDHRVIWLEYLVVSFLSYLSFTPIARVVAQVPVRLPACTIHQVTSSVMVPFTGFLFAVFTERATQELKDRIDTIELVLNRQAALLMLLIPHLQLLLQNSTYCVGAFLSLHVHVQYLLELLSGWHDWHCIPLEDDPDNKEALIQAVTHAERTMMERGRRVGPVHVENLRVVNDLLWEFLNLRSVRVSTEESSLPPQMWFMMAVFAVIFSFTFMWAAVNAVQPRFAQIARDADESNTGRMFASIHDVVLMDRWLRSKRLSALWAMLVVSQYVVLQMCVDMRNPYMGQYRVDGSGSLVAVFRGPVMLKIQRALDTCERGL